MRNELQKTCLVIGDQMKELDEEWNEIGKALLAQNHQVVSAEQRISDVNKNIESLDHLQHDQSEALDHLLAQATMLVNGHQIQQEQHSFSALIVPDYDDLQPLSISDKSWNDFSKRIDTYLIEKGVAHENPYEDLLSAQQKAEIAKTFREEFMLKNESCDRYDYMIAAFSGLVTGLIDSFFVGSPLDSKIMKWSDQKVDKIVIKFSKMVWNHDKANGSNIRTQPDSIASAIGYLERRFKVNYDARYASDLKMNGESLNMRPTDHHLKSLAHAPDIIGLFFSILDQFTGKASFVSDGKLLRLKPKEDGSSRLVGGTILSKLFAGFSNWLGHLLSDISGSSGTRGHSDGRRGAGIPLPFFEVFQFANVGNIKHNGADLTIAEFSTKVFEKGYDARFGAAMAVPVVLNELIIRLLWGLKSKFYHQKSFIESLPFGNKPTLRKMLLVGQGSLCLTDGIDAYLRSNNVPILFATRLNYVAWSRFMYASIKEVRVLLKGDVLDIQALDRHLEEEWQRLGL